MIYFLNLVSQASCKFLSCIFKVLNFCVSDTILYWQDRNEAALHPKQALNVSSPLHVNTFLLFCSTDS